MSFPFEATVYVCPDAPSQVLATWNDLERDECPWCKRSLKSSHDHFLWCLKTGVSSADAPNTDSEPQ